DAGRVGDSFIAQHSSRSLPVSLAEHDVDAAEDRHDVGDLMPLAHLAEHRQVGEAWRADVIAPRILPRIRVAGRDDVIAKLALRILNAPVCLTQRDARRVYLAAGEDRLVLSRFEARQNLLEYTHAFAHLVEAQQVAVVNV